MRFENLPVITAGQALGAMAATGATQVVAEVSGQAAAHAHSEPNMLAAAILGGLAGAVRTSFLPALREDGDIRVNRLAITGAMSSFAGIVFGYFLALPLGALAEMALGKLNGAPIEVAGIVPGLAMFLALGFEQLSASLIKRSTGEIEGRGK